MRQFQFFEAVKIDGPKNKILEFNGTDKFMDDKELKHFENLTAALADKNKYFNTKISDYGDQLMLKLI